MTDDSWTHPPTLTGHHVLVRPTVSADAPGLAAAYDDPALFTYFPYGLASTPPSADTVAAALASDRLALTVVNRASGRVIGSTALYNANALHRRVTIGFTWYSAAVHGTVANPETKLLLLDHVFDTMGALRAEFTVDNLNTRSRHALLSLGATEEGALRHHTRRRDGSWRTTIVYSVLAGEWPELRERLTARIANRLDSSAPRR